jgi:signal transduction histidine kinase
MRDPLSRVQIKYKLPAAFVGVCLVAFGVGGYLISVSAGEALEQEILLRLRAESDAVARSLEARLTLLGRRAEDFASDGFIRTHVERLLDSADAGGAAGWHASHERLLAHLRRNKYPLVQPLADLALYRRDGGMLVSVRGGTDTIPLRSSADTLWCSGFTEDAGTGRLQFMLSVPVRDMDLRHVLALLVFRIDVEDWLGTDIDPVGKQPVGKDAVGKDAVGKDPVGKHPVGKDAVARDAGGKHALSIVDREGRRHDVVGDPPRNALVHARTIPLTGWTLRVSADAEEAMAPVSGLQSRFLGAGLLLGFAALVLLFFPIRFLVRPLTAMGDAARAIAEGDYSRRVEVAADDEIGRLATSFNRMADAVRERTEALESSAHLLERRGRELAIERDLLTTVVHSMQDAVLYHDRHGDIVLHNRAGTALGEALRRGELHPAPRRCCNGSATVADCERCLRDHSLPPRECTVDIGEQVYEILFTGIASGGAPEGTLLVARDITHRMRLDERQAHRDRLAVLGEVSAVMAHELNNPLAAISLYAQMMRDEMATESEFREHLDVILRNTDSCKRTIRDLLSYSRDTATDGADCDLHALLPDVLRFLRPLYEKGDILLETENLAREGLAACDETHARQIVVNLVINALQAMRGGSGRCLLRSFDADERHIGLDVIDDGPGIPVALQELIFEPFYTSKPSGEGTGLGLSISRRLADAYGGSLRLESSRPGETVFRLVLPRREQSVPRRVAFPRTEIRQVKHADV